MGAWPTIPQSRQVKVASSFEHLRDFIRKRMRMSHIYQPVMIKELLTMVGRSNIRNIAAAFLARDASQLEYYEQITKDMPGKVLAKHGIVEREGKDYRLSADPSSLSSEERDELVRLCDEAISTYLQKRGTAVYDHRRAALGYLSGSLRYEVLKRAGFRCAVLTNPAYYFKRIGLEAGPLSQWLYSTLAEAGLPVICVETRHMRAVLKAQINKTDRNDARGMARAAFGGRDRHLS